MSIQYSGNIYKSTTALSTYHQSGEYKGMKSWLGLAVGAIVSIAIPFVAPAIGTMFGAGFFASTAGQALIGAGLGALGGAASSAISGGDALTGALYGGAAGALGAGGRAFFGGAGLTTAAAPGAAAGAGTGAGLTSTGIETAQLGAGGLGGTPTNIAAGLNTGATGTFSSGAVSDAFLKMGTQAAATALTQLTTPDQEKYLEAMKAELESAGAINQADYQRKLALYQTLVDDAMNRDPTTFARFAEANAMQRAAVAGREMEREASMRHGEDSQQAQNRQRQAALTGSQEASTAYATGLVKGFDYRDAGLQTAASSSPTFSNAGTVAGLGSLYQLQDAANQRTAEGYGALFEPLTYAFASKQPQRKTSAYA